MRDFGLLPNFYNRTIVCSRKAPFYRPTKCPGVTVPGERITHRSYRRGETLLFAVASGTRFLQRTRYSDMQSFHNFPPQQRWLSPARDVIQSHVGAKVNRYETPSQNVRERLQPPIRPNGVTITRNVS